MSARAAYLVHGIGQQGVVYICDTCLIECDENFIEDEVLDGVFCSEPCRAEHPGVRAA